MSAATPSKDVPSINSLMERASRQLVHRQYFACEQNALAALQMALAAEDFERAARIIMPLQEARRQKRDMAFDAGYVERVGEQIPPVESLRPGCYLFEPPRVGIEGRALRDEADRRSIPIILVVREPITRSGLWPIVAVGPCTIRTRVPPPAPHSSSSGSHRNRSRKSPPAGEAPLPEPEWFLRANEALGDAAIAQVAEETEAAARVQMLAERLMALPDHEKLHQSLQAACQEAARDVLRRPRKRTQEVAPAPKADDEND